jgi:NmrA-like family
MMNREEEVGREAASLAKAEGVQHFIWSTLPNVEKISRGKWTCPHWTHKARVDAFVKALHFKVRTGCWRVPRPCCHLRGWHTHAPRCH